MDLKRNNFKKYLVAAVYIVLIICILRYNKGNYENILRQSKVSFEGKRSVYTKNFTSSDLHETRRSCNNRLKLNLTDLVVRYPELEGQINTTDGQCTFQKPYSHLNSLLDFDSSLELTAIFSPSKCANEDIVFGIKSRPGSENIRNAIRETWLRRDLWQSLNYEIKVVFIIAREDSVNINQLENERKKHGDILFLDFNESFHRLVNKDIGYLNFLKESCPQTRLVFKGDDDILLVPRNLRQELDIIESKENKIEAIGCYKSRADVIRNPRSRYFLPEEIFGDHFFAPYYPGAAYVTTGEFTIKMAEALSSIKVIPMDDVFVGELIKRANLTDKMGSSLSICSGVKPRNMNLTDTCFLRGLTLAHKYTDPQFMKKTFFRMNKDPACSRMRVDEITEDIKTFFGEDREGWKDAWVEKYNNYAEFK